MTLGSRLLVAVVVGGAVFGIASAVQASIPDSSGVAHGCYYIPPKLGGTSQLPGDLRLIDTDKGQHCNSDEGSVDLATTGFVTSQINQTSFMFKGTFTYPSNGDWETTFFCGSGWVGINPWVGQNAFFGNNVDLTVRSEQNLGELATGVPDGNARVYYNISAGAPFTANQAATCVNGRVYGLAGPAAPIAQAMSQATATTARAQ